MDTTSFHTISEADMVDYYVSQAVQLSANARRQLIERLSQTLTATPVAQATANPPLPDFVGAWANDAEADKMEAAIQANRHFTNKIDAHAWE